MDFVGNNGFTATGNMGFGGIPQGTGYQYNGFQPQQVPQIKNWLTNEEIDRLVRKENQFSLVLTEVDKMRATCNHRFNNGQDAITTDKDGRCMCNICGYEFEPMSENTDEDTLNEVVKATVDVLQTVKLLYLDMPDEVAREYFAIIPLIEKIPKLFTMAVKSYQKYEGYNPYGFNNKNMNTMQMYSMIAGILGGQQPMGGFAQPMGGYAQPQPGMGFGQPTMSQTMGGFAQPQPGMGFGQPMGQPYTSNGFVMNQPVGYQPSTQGVAYVPNQQAAPQQQPTATATPATEVKPDGTVESTQTFTV